MPYLLILRRDQARELGIAYEEMHERFATWTRHLGEAGILRSVERLKPATEAVTLRQEDGDITTDGRFASTEDVIGYYLLDVPDIGQAQQHARACPILTVGGSVEIRETEPFLPDSSQ